MTHDYSGGNRADIIVNTRYGNDLSTDGELYILGFDQLIRLAHFWVGLFFEVCNVFNLYDTDTHSLIVNVCC